MLPATIVHQIWNWLYSSSYGLFNSWLTTVGLPAVNWLSDPGSAMTSIVIATVWWTVGFNFVLYLAGLQEIPRELFEAAAIDGADKWATLRSITIPLLKRTTTLIVILQAGTCFAEGLRSDLSIYHWRPQRHHPLRSRIHL